MSQALERLYDPRDGQMQIVGLMSGTGSNLVEIIMFEELLKAERGVSPYHVAVIFSDTAGSSANRIGKDWDLPVITRDIEGFYAKKGIPKKDILALMSIPQTCQSWMALGENTQVTMQ